MEMDFKAWSEIILIGQQRYAAEWKSRFVCECTPLQLSQAARSLPFSRPNKRSAMRSRTGAGETTDCLFSLPTCLLATFQRFDVWVKAANTACSSFKLNLGSILSGLGINLNLFLGININLGGLLGINLNLGGLLGGLHKRNTLLLE